MKVIQVLDNNKNVKHQFSTYQDYINYLRSKDYDPELLTTIRKI